MYYEYRDAGGVLFPRVWATVFDQRDPPHVFMVDDVQLNPVLDEALFRLPR